MPDYKFHEYEDLTKNIEEVTRVVTKYKTKTGSNLVPHDLKDKLGDKLAMTGLIMNLTTLCLQAKDLLSKMHGNNFELRGTVSKLSSAAISTLTEEIRENQKEIKHNVDEVIKKCEKTSSISSKTDFLSFVDVVGDNGKAFVSPMKQALKQIEKEEEKAVNVVVHGHDLNPDIKDNDKQEESLKEDARFAIIEVLAVAEERETITNEEKRMTDEIVLGKIRKNGTGKAPPIMLKMQSVKIARLTVKNASCLSKVKGMRNVYITPYLSKDEQDRMRRLRSDLKDMIEEFPDKRWVIR